jgi:hypothetical protein
MWSVGERAFGRLPAIEGLISLKQSGEMRPRDLEDIEFPEKIKSAVSQSDRRPT